MTEEARWWEMRPAQGRQAKTYTCPICHRRLLAMNPNTLMFPEATVSIAVMPIPNAWPNSGKPGNC